VMATPWTAERDAPHEELTFAAAAERHLDDVYAYLLYLTGNRELAEDLTGETFERALRRWRRFDPRRGSARTWLCQLARSSALDHFRAERRRRRREQTVGGLDREETEVVFGEGLSAELETALRRLSAAEREVIALRVVLDLEVEPAARLLGISKTACTTRLSRALEKLERLVKGDERD
jgi:RNA polymerase sigma-70 factor (ECF subfamily)